MEGFKISKRGRIYLPLRKLHFFLYLFMTFLFMDWLLFMFGYLAERVFELPSWVIITIVYLSLFGSLVNIPLFYVQSYKMIVRPQVIRFFFVDWVIPEIDWEEQKTLVAINLGGAIIPVALSVYLMYKIALNEGYLILGKLFIAIILASFLINRVAKPIPGLGIATPAIVPPIVTIFSVFIVHPFITTNTFYAMLYITGTLSTLIGADIMNLDKIPDLGAPVASIGGAGTFDGVYLTGLMAVWLASIFII